MNLYICNISWLCVENTNSSKNNLRLLLKKVFALVSLSNYEYNRMQQYIFDYFSGIN